MMGTLKKTLPEFSSEDEERKFWAKADSTKYLDWFSARRRRLVKLKPSPFGRGVRKSGAQKRFS
jgi:hypothetical protein